VKGKIAMFLDQDFPPDIRVEKEIQTLMDAGYDVRLFVLTYRKNKETEVVRGINIYRHFGTKFLYKLSALAYTLPLFHFFIEKMIKAFVRSHQPDFLHVHDMVIAAAVLKVSKKFNIPMVLDLHENRPAIMELYAHVNKFPGNVLINLKRWQKAQLHLQQQTDRLILVTEEAKQHAISREGIDSNKIFVVPNTVKKDFESELSVSRSIENRLKDKFCILYFGDTALRRGTDTMIEAVFLLRERIPNIHAILVGKGSEDFKLVAQAEKLGIRDCISFEGWQDVSLLKAYAAGSEIGICPFRRNLHHDTTFANKLFQFMGLGLPLIVSDCPSQVNVIKKYNCGLVFDAENANDLADKILNLYNNKDLRKKLGQNGEKAIREDLHWEITSKSLVDLYHSFKN
jgi:glycosyltransferase involved in cell wall biosynthesis